MSNFRMVLLVVGMLALVVLGVRHGGKPVFEAVGDNVPFPSQAEMEEAQAERLMKPVAEPDAPPPQTWSDEEEERQAARRAIIAEKRRTARFADESERDLAEE